MVAGGRGVVGLNKSSPNSPEQSGARRIWPAVIRGEVSAMPSRGLSVSPLKVLSFCHFVFLQARGFFTAGQTGRGCYYKHKHTITHAELSNSTELLLDCHVPMMAPQFLTHQVMTTYTLPLHASSSTVTQPIIHPIVHHFPSNPPQSPF